MNQSNNNNMSGGEGQGHAPSAYSHGQYSDWRGQPPSPPSPWELERRVSLLEQSTKNIKEELSKINANLSKLVWIVISAVVLMILNTAMTGGIGA